MDPVMDHAATTYLAVMAQHGGEPVAIVGLLGEPGVKASTVAGYSRARGLVALTQWGEVPQGLDSVPDEEVLFYLLNVGKIGEVGTGNLTEAEFSALYDEGIKALGEYVDDPERYDVESLDSRGPAYYIQRVKRERAAALGQGAMKPGSSFFVQGGA